MEGLGKIIGVGFNGQILLNPKLEILSRKNSSFPRGRLLQLSAVSCWVSPCPHLPFLSHWRALLWILILAAEIGQTIHNAMNTKEVPTWSTKNVFYERTVSTADFWATCSCCGVQHFSWLSPATAFWWNWDPETTWNPLNPVSFSLLANFVRFPRYMKKWLQNLTLFRYFGPFWWCIYVHGFSDQCSIFMKRNGYTICSATCEWFPSCRLPEHSIFHPTLHRSDPRQVSWAYCKCLCNLVQLLLPSIKRFVSWLFLFTLWHRQLLQYNYNTARGADRSGRISSDPICAWNSVEYEYLLLCHQKCHHFQSNVYYCTWDSVRFVSLFIVAVDRLVFGPNAALCMSGRCHVSGSIASWPNPIMMMMTIVMMVIVVVMMMIMMMMMIMIMIMIMMIMINNNNNNNDDDDDEDDDDDDDDDDDFDDGDDGGDDDHRNVFRKWTQIYITEGVNLRRCHSGMHLQYFTTQYSSCRLTRFPLEWGGSLVEWFLVLLKSQPLFAFHAICFGAAITMNVLYFSFGSVESTLKSVHQNWGLWLPPKMIAFIQAYGKFMSSLHRSDVVKFPMFLTTSWEQIFLNRVCQFLSLHCMCVCVIKLCSHLTCVCHVEVCSLGPTSHYHTFTLFNMFYWYSLRMCVCVLYIVILPYSAEFIHLHIDRRTAASKGTYIHVYSENLCTVYIYIYLFIYLFLCTLRCTVHLCFWIHVSYICFFLIDCGLDSAPLQCNPTGDSVCSHWKGYKGCPNMH